MDPFCRIASVWKSAAQRRGHVVSSHTQLRVAYPPISYLPVLQVSEETRHRGCEIMNIEPSPVDRSMKFDIDDDTSERTAQDVSFSPFKSSEEPFERASSDVAEQPSAQPPSDVASTPPLDIPTKRAANTKRPTAPSKQCSTKRQKQSDASDSARRSPVIVYGIHMLKYNNSNPSLEVHAPQNIDKLSFDAKCRWLDVPELADVWFASMNLAGEALRHVNAKLPLKPRVLTCDVFNSLCIDLASGIRLHDLRKQSEIETVFP